MFREALGYPTKAPTGGRVILVGGALLILIAAFIGPAGIDTAYAPVALLALVPWLLVRGYYVRVIRTTIGREDPVPPTFRPLGPLLADGLKAVVVAVVYLVPPGVVLGPLGYARATDVDLGTLVVGWGVPAALSTAVVSAFGVLAIVALMYLIGALYAIPVAVARFAHAGELRAAFEVRSVVDGALTEDYVIAWFVSLLLQVLLLPVAYLLRVLLIGFFLQFLVALGVRYCYGQGAGAGMQLSPVQDAAGLEDSDGDETEDDTELTPAFTRLDDSRK